MNNNIYSILNVISSISLLISISLINQSYKVSRLLKYFNIDIPSDSFINDYSWAIFIILPFIFAGFILILKGRLEATEILGDTIKEIRTDNSSFIATILGYIFIGLSISNLHSLFVAVSLMILFNILGSAYIYNPIFLLFGYKYYFINTNKIFVLVISRRKIIREDTTEFESLVKINDYTYLEVKPEKLKQRNGLSVSQTQ